MQTTPERYQKQSTQPLLGMANFRRWRHPDAQKISPSDIDAWQHARVGDRHLFTEFKTSNEDTSKMGGQLEGLLSLSRRPGIQVLIVFDPYWNDPSDTRMDPETPLRVQLLRSGQFVTVRPTTIGRFAQAVWDWQWNRGPLAEPTT